MDHGGNLSKKRVRKSPRHLGMVYPMKAARARKAPNRIYNWFFRNEDRVLRVWAERKQARLGQIALAWLLAQKPFIVPIPGTTQMAHMFDNIGAAEVTFSADELAALNAALAGITIQGERLPPAVQAFSGVEAPLK